VNLTYTRKWCVYYIGNGAMGQSTECTERVGHIIIIIIIIIIVIRWFQDASCTDISCSEKQGLGSCWCGLHRTVKGWTYIRLQLLMVATLREYVLLNCWRSQQCGCSSSVLDNLTYYSSYCVLFLSFVNASVLLMMIHKSDLRWYDIRL